MRERGSESSRGHGAGAAVQLETGGQLRDRRSDRLGTVLDVACQYAHPKAEPVYNYLVRWDDGQIEALSQAALDGTHGLEVVADPDRPASDAEASRSSSLAYDDTP
jgi:hypothetical protein